MILRVMHYSVVTGSLEYKSGTIETSVAVSQNAQLQWLGALDVTTGLVGHWSLDSDGSDSSGNSLDGSLGGNASIDTSVPTNQIGTGKISLDGINDYLDLSAHAATLQSGQIEAEVAISETAQQQYAGVLAPNTAPTFGVGDGSVTTAIGAGNDSAQSTVMLPDGKFLVVGYSHNGSDNDFVLARYNADGSLDTNFNGTGIVTTAVGTGFDNASDIIVQPDGKILVAGGSNNGSDNDMALVRYNADGTLDTSFGGGDGIATLGFGFGSDSASSVLLQADGKIVLVGNAYNGSYQDVAVVRYNADGTLDTSFSGDGKTTIALSATSDYGIDGALQADGKILVTGQANNSLNNKTFVLRLDTNGVLDTSFSGRRYCHYRC